MKNMEAMKKALYGKMWNERRIILQKMTGLDKNVIDEIMTQASRKHFEVIEQDNDYTFNGNTYTLRLIAQRMTA